MLSIDLLVRLMEELKGVEFGPLGEPLRITQHMINQHAEETGDRQWIHTDPKRIADRGLFGGTTIAHGTLIMCLLPKLLSHAISLTSESTKAMLNSMGFWHFCRPVKAGSAIRAQCKIGAIRHIRLGNIMPIEVKVKSASSDKLLAHFFFIVVVV